jgi:PIN domain nuclease of toxin-antitoxin system/antitoxin (DNA-binding transcriptional repressor) of toxin-antitoxin stability system
MEIVTIHTAKTTLSQLLARVEAGEEIVLARGREPTAKLVPFHPPRRGRRFGACAAASAWGPNSSSRCPRRNWPPGSSACACLLDSHAFLWWPAGDEALSAAARTAIADEKDDVFVSAASALEIATRHRIGRLPGVAAIIADLDDTIAEQSFIGRPISVRHGQAAGALPGPHRDPFDRMLIAQAMLDRLVPVSNEQIFDTYGVGRWW